MKPKQPKKRDPKPKEVSGKVEENKTLTRIDCTDGSLYTIYFSQESIESIRQQWMEKEANKIWVKDMNFHFII